MGQIAVVENHKEVGLIEKMARAYEINSLDFSNTVKQTCMPENATKEEFAAFLLIANKYGLNPIAREIYAFPKKGGGIQPIVSIDGWMNLINSHPQCDGMEFVDQRGDDGKISAITCRIFRKDRGRPTEVTEYMNECSRAGQKNKYGNPISEPWDKWPIRMLRHKAAIQCARYAFGFAGIIDPDEAERSPEVITTGSPVVQSAIPPSPPPAPEKIEAEVVETVSETAEDNFDPFSEDDWIHEYAEKAIYAIHDMNITHDALDVQKSSFLDDRLSEKGRDTVNKIHRYATQVFIGEIEPADGEKLIMAVSEL